MAETLENKPKLPGFISLLLVIALSVSLAKLMWLVITPQQQTSFSSQNEGIASIAPKEETNYGKIIADQHIFGEEVVKKAPKVQKKDVVKKVVKATPKVKLNAKLHGIVAYKSQEGFALISNNNGAQKVYAKGDKLQDGVIISNILPTKVVVDNNGIEEELLLPEKFKNATSKSSPKPRARTNANFNASLPQARVPNTAQANEKPDLNQFRQEVLSDASKLTDIVRATPAIINGQFVGFRVRSGKNRKLFRQLSFKSNDIVTEVNGIVLDDASKGIQVLSQLENATNLALKVKRGNEEIYIDHSF